MSSLLRFFRSAHIALSPVSPVEWRRWSRAYSRGMGWLPPLLVLGSLGAIIPARVGFGLGAGIEALEWLHLLTVITWLIVSLWASAIIAGRSLRNVRRYGVAGVTRPRWWFELARLAFMCSLIAMAGLLPGFFLPGLDLPFGGALQALVEAGLVLFLLSAMGGYLLAFARRERCSGRAFECTQFFILAILGGGLLGQAATLWPWQNFWPIGARAVVQGLVGAGTLVWLFLWAGDNADQWQRRQRPLE